jgi:quinone-modifying oxidoreductase subunit QmoA
MPKAKEACKYDAIDFDMQAKTLDLDVGAIVWATGWEPYDATKIDNLGFGQYDNIITNMMMERLAAPNGSDQGPNPAPGRREGSGKRRLCSVRRFRDENHLPYCSYICCMASLKQATYVREQYPDAKSIFSTSTSGSRTTLREILPDHQRR